jgi:hypothetical protein
MIHTFIISHERIFPIERGAKYYKWDEKKLLSMEESWIRFIPKIKSWALKEKK